MYEVDPWSETAQEPDHGPDPALGGQWGTVLDDVEVAVLTLLIRMRCVSREQFAFLFGWCRFNQSLPSERPDTIENRVRRLMRWKALGRYGVDGLDFFFPTGRCTRLLLPEHATLRRPALSRVPDLVAAAQIAIHYLAREFQVHLEVDRRYTNWYSIPGPGYQNVVPVLMARNGQGRLTVAVKADAMRRQGFHRDLVDEVVERFGALDIWAVSPGLASRIADEVSGPVDQGLCRVHVLPASGRVFLLT